MKYLLLSFLVFSLSASPLHADEIAPLSSEDITLMEQLSSEDLEMLQMIELLELLDLLGDIDTLVRLEDES